MTDQQLQELKKIMAIQFSVLELNLYLDTHPNDRKALKDFNQLVKELKKLKFEYQKEYGPICYQFPSEYPWQYPKTAWPWQIEY